MNTSFCDGLPIHSDGVLTSQYSNLYTAAACVLILISVFAVSANTIVIVSLLRSNFRSQPGSGVNVNLVKSLMTSMAVSDAIIGAISMPVGIYELFKNGHWFLGNNLCTIKQMTDVFLCTVSIYHVICMAIDRYLAVCKPFVYRKLSKKASYYMIALSWTIPGALSTIPFLNDWYSTGVSDIILCFQKNHYCSIVFNLPHQVSSVVISFYIPITVIYALYYLIAREIWLVLGRTRKFRSGFALQKCDHYHKVVSETTSNDNCSSKHNRHLCTNDFSEVKIVPDTQLENVVHITYPNDGLDLNVTDGLTLCASQLNPVSIEQNGNLAKCCLIHKGPQRPIFSTGKVLSCPSYKFDDASYSDTCKNNGIESNQCFPIESASGYKSCIDLSEVLPCNRLSRNENISFQTSAPSSLATQLTEAPATSSSSAQLSRVPPSTKLSPPSATLHQFTESTSSVELPTTLLPTFAPSTTTSATAQTSTETLSSVLLSTRLQPRAYPLQEDTTVAENKHEQQNNLLCTEEQSHDGDDTCSPATYTPATSTTRTTKELTIKGFGNTKAVSTIGIVVVCFTLCWLPFSIYVVVLSYLNYSLPMWPYLLLTWLGYLNSALNPVLYCCNRSIREAVRYQIFSILYDRK